MISKRTEQEIRILREGREIMAALFNRVADAIDINGTSMMAEKAVEEGCRKYGVKPAFKGYMGFPYCVCASPNDVVVHGFPNNDRLQSGDILSIDFGILIDKCYLDCAYTFAVGTINPEADSLLKITKKACLAGIQAAQVGNVVRDIGRAVESVVKTSGYGIVRDYVGHGIGHQLHEAIQIPNFDNGADGPSLEAGMTLAIEPMINLGSREVYVAENKWAVCTSDRTISAHFEHTALVTDNGPEIMTAWPQEAQTGV